MSSEESDCPLCLLPLLPYDDAHPIQCSSQHCNFNCCLDCLQRMIQATKDESTEASDGNVFKVFLHCPNCRSNLGPSIRDTILLRKVDKRLNDNEIIDETKLPASELQFQKACKDDVDISNAIEEAKQREDEFFGRDKSLDFYLGKSASISAEESVVRQESVWSFDDEEGVEISIDNGPHKSFVFRHHSQIDLSSSTVDEEEVNLEDVPVDLTLLSGLDGFMTEQEKQFITSQFISGNTNKLAGATEMMHYVGLTAKQGIKPSMKRKKSMLIRQPTAQRSVLASISELIKEGNEARKMEDEKEGRNAVGVVASQLKTIAGGKRNQKQLVDIEMKQQMQYMKSHPLPLRMPKYVEVVSSTAKDFSCTFVDDTWNGTVLDAYSKITVRTSLLSSKVTISKQHAESSGIRRVIDAGSSDNSKTKGKGYIDIERPRVIIASINKEMGRQGVVKGDVVSHFNGEEFKGTAAELKELIDTSRYEGEVLTFALNADAAVAEALKRRSMISD